MKKAALLVGTIVAGLMGTAVAAFALGEHGHAHHSSAIMPCVAVMTPSQRANLRQLFGGQRQTFMTDRQTVHQAKTALTQAILSGSQDLSSQEEALSAAQQQMLKDRDAFALQVCSQLTPSQLSAAQTMYKKLTALHESSRAQERRIFQDARAAAGGE